MTTQQSPYRFNRRYCERFVLPPMYSAVTVRRSKGMATHVLDGHAYDISETGIRIELDEPLNVGEVVLLTLELPGQGRDVTVWAEAVRVYDQDDDPAARRAALQFHGFATPEDRAQLLMHLGSGTLRRAA